MPKTPRFTSFRQILSHNNRFTMFVNEVKARNITDLSRIQIHEQVDLAFQVVSSQQQASININHKTSIYFDALVSSYCNRHWLARFTPSHNHLTVMEISADIWKYNPGCAPKELH